MILAAIGLDPWNIIESVRELIERVWNMGFDAVRWLWRYFLLGAVIVVPIWLLVRLAKAPRGAVAAASSGAPALPEIHLGRQELPRSQLSGYSSTESAPVCGAPSVFGGMDCPAHGRADRRDGAGAADAAESGPAARHSRSVHCRLGWAVSALAVLRGILLRRLAAGDE